MVYYDGGKIPQIGAANLLTLTPSISGAALPSTVSGNIDWACASSGTTTAAAEGLPVTAGTVLSRYAPTQCK